MQVRVKRFYIQNRDWVLFTVMTAVGLVVALSVIHKPASAETCIQQAQGLNTLAQTANRTGFYPDRDYVVYHPLGTRYSVNPTVIEKCFQ